MGRLWWAPVITNESSLKNSIHDQLSVWRPQTPLISLVDKDVAR